MFHQNFVAGFIIIRASHFVHADGPFFNTKCCTHFNESQKVRFALLMGN